MHEPENGWDRRVREAYERPLAGEAEARERALARLRNEPAPRGGWWLDADALRLSPLTAAAVVVLALVLGAAGGARWAKARHDQAAAMLPPPARAPIVAPMPAAAAGATTVTFAFRAPGAARVCLVGDFNGWDPNATPLHRAATGEVWTVDLPLPRGLHAYAFIVDGADWSVDPSAPLAPETTFGRRNALLVVDEKGAL